ncbi:MAG: hypothetical protein HY521_14975 [Proteobacteria bacterium]|nr:hypothetical protein [Pseudomonadota bacterium]
MTRIAIETQVQGAAQAAAELERIRASTRALSESVEGLREGASRPLLALDSLAEGSDEALAHQRRLIDDLGQHTDAVAGQMRLAFGRFFAGALRDGASFGDRLKGLFSGLASAILSELARLAQDRVFRLLFGQGSATAQAPATSPAGGILSGLPGLGSGGLLGDIVPGNLAAFVGPALGGLTGLLQGNIRRAVASTGLGIAGALLGGPVGGLIGAAIGGFFQSGGERIVTRPTLLAVGETGPERVRIEPLAAGAGPAPAGIRIDGLALIDEIGMARLERLIERAMRNAARRII